MCDIDIHKKTTPSTIPLEGTHDMPNASSIDQTILPQFKLYTNPVYTLSYAKKQEPIISLQRYLEDTSNQNKIKLLYIFRDICIQLNKLNHKGYSYYEIKAENIIIVDIDPPSIIFMDFLDAPEVAKFGTTEMDSFHLGDMLLQLNNKHALDLPCELLFLAQAAKNPLIEERPIIQDFLAVITKRLSVSHYGKLAK